MRTVVIIHGTENTSQGNWFPSLAASLRKNGFNVIAPDFPTPDGQNLTAWLAVFEKAASHLDPASTILIGHSTGAVCALRIAESTPIPYLAVFCVCPFIEDLGFPAYDSLNASFVHPAWDWARVKAGAQHLLLLAGDNDPYVPLRNVQNIQAATDAELCVIPEGGHLNRDSGYEEFPLLENHLLSFRENSILQKR